MATSGEKKNNPGCIMGKSGLKQYTTLEEGYEALNSLLYRKYNNRTCYDIFKQYAPYSDGNNPREYADFVINQLNQKGIPITDSSILNLDNPLVLQELTLAISKMENGKVLGGDAFARNCSIAFAYKKGLSSDQPVAMASQSYHAPVDNPQTAIQQTPTAETNPDLIESLKKNQAMAEVQQTKTQEKKTDDTKNAIIALLVSATTSLLTKNSAVGSIISKIMENSLKTNDSNTKIAQNNKDNQNA